MKRCAVKAITEEIERQFRTKAALGLSVLIDVAEDKDHPQRIRAAEALLNRGGFHAMTEQTIKVEHRDMTGTAMLERIRALAGKHGLDPASLIGGNTVIEGEVVALEDQRDEPPAVEGEKPRDES
jgi:hypothetical protein